MGLELNRRTEKNTKNEVHPQVSSVHNSRRWSVTLLPTKEKDESMPMDSNMIQRSKNLIHILSSTTENAWHAKK